MKRKMKIVPCRACVFCGENPPVCQVVKPSYSLSNEEYLVGSHHCPLVTGILDGFWNCPF